KRDVAAVAVDLAAERIQTHTGDLPHGRPAVAAATVERSETKHKLLEFEGLGEIVVSAEFETGGLIVEPVGSGEHKNRHAGARGHDLCGDLVAGGPRDVAVQDCDVVRVDP